MIDYEEIRDRSVGRLIELDVPIHPNLPLRDESVTRSGYDVALQIISLYAQAGLANGANPTLLQKWLIDEAIWGRLGETEADVLSGRDLTEPEMNALSWKQESLYALVWAGGLIGDMPLPVSECDLGPVFMLIPPEVQTAVFLNRFALRDETDILRVLDFYYCLHASIKHGELWDDLSKRKKYAICVVEERRQALEWLCSPATELWSDVTLDT